MLTRMLHLHSSSLAQVSYKDLEGLSVHVFASEYLCVSCIYLDPALPRSGRESIQSISTLMFIVQLSSRVSR